MPDDGRAAAYDHDRPERAAEAILDGVRHRRYMVYTSPDIRIGHWIQRKLGWPYELAMRAAQQGVNRIT